MSLPTYPGLYTRYLNGTPLSGKSVGDISIRSYLRLDATDNSYVSFASAYSPTATDQIISCKVRLG